MKNDQAKPTRRRWLQIGLRTSLIGMTLVCIAVGLFLNSVRLQRDAVALLSKNDAYIVYDDDESMYPQWAIDRFGIDCFHSVIEVFPGIVTAAEQLRPLSDIPSVRDLELSSAQVRTLDPISGLRNLESLSIRNSWVDHLDAVSEMDKLQSLFALRSDLRDMDGLTSLHHLRNVEVNDTRVLNLNGLQNSSELEDLEAANTRISDLAPLRNSRQLERLYLRDTNVFDLRPLSEMRMLQHLNLLGTQVADLEPLRELVQLINLNLQDTQVTDIDPLSAMTELQELQLGGCQVTSLEPLSNLTNLTLLTIGGREIDDAGPLRNLISMKKLTLQSTSAADMSFLANLPDLDCLEITGCPVTQLDVIANFPALRWVHLEDLPIEDVSAVATLQLNGLTLKKLPAADLTPIFSMQDLTKLTLDDMGIEGFQQISGMTSLLDLDAPDNPVRSLGGIEAVAATLRSLNLDRSQITDLRPLSSCQFLGKLSLAETPADDLAPLTGLRSLWSLSLNDTPVSDLKPLANADLQELFVARTHVADLTPLMSFKQLRTLDISYSKVTDLSPLYKLWELAQVRLSGIDVSDQQIDELSAALPFCEVIRLPPRGMKHESLGIIVKDIAAQLEYDDLSYTWLLGIVERHRSMHPFALNCEILVSAIEELINNDAIIIGDARCVHGVEEFVQWTGSDEELLERLRTCIAEVGEPRLFSDGFWIRNRP